MYREVGACMFQDERLLPLLVGCSPHSLADLHATCIQFARYSEKRKNEQIRHRIVYHNMTGRQRRTPLISASHMIWKGETRRLSSANKRMGVI
jgi:hypothetical protein